MQRRQFLRGGLLLGAAGLFPGLVPVSSALSAIVPPTEPLMPIWEAAIAGHWNIVKEWLRRDPSLIAVTGFASEQLHHDGKVTLFYLAAATNSDAGLLKFLVSCGADVHMEVAAKFGDKTPLHVASPNSLEVVQYLVSQGADVNAMSKHCGTPLCCAARENSVEVLKHLVSLGADINVNYRRYTPLHRAAERNSVEALQYLVSLGADVHSLNDYGSTPLHDAAYRSNHEIVDVDVLKYLVSQGAKVNVQNKDGDTPLHKAAGHGSVEVVDYLISQGADVNAKDNKGMTALDCAKKWEAYYVEYYVERAEFYQRKVEERREVIARLRRAMG